MGKLTFGIFPLGLAGSPTGVAAGPPDDFAKIADAAAELQGDSPPLLPRMYVSWTGPRSTKDVLRHIDALTPQSIPWDLVLCYRDRSGSVTEWTEFVAAVVREHGRELAAVQVTGEANLAGIAAAADGDYPEVRKALVKGVLAAADAKRDHHATAAIGFAVAPEADPAASGFWPEIKNLGGADFGAALDCAGIDAYPDVFGPRFGVDQLPMAVDWILRTFRERDLDGAGIPASVPIRICENGWPTGPDRPEETQADVLEAVIRTTAALSDELNVTHWELFTLRDADSAGDGMFFHFGVLRDDYSRKPAFARLRALIAELSQRGSSPQGWQGHNRAVDRERAELHLRRLAEAELRNAAEGHGRPPYRLASLSTPPDGGRLARVAQALMAIGAIDAGTAEGILADQQLGLAVRRSEQQRSELISSPAARRRIARMVQAGSGYGTAAKLALLTGAQAPARQAACPAGTAEQPPRVAPVGMMLPVRADDCRGEVFLLAYLHTAASAGFTMTGWMRHRDLLIQRPAPMDTGIFAVTDAKGNNYRVRFAGTGDGGAYTGMLHLDPEPAVDTDWLDVTAGAATRRVQLTPPAETAQVTTLKRTPGELYLHGVAAGILASVPVFPDDRRYRDPMRLPARLADGLGDIIAALRAAGALYPLTPLPGQLATLCESLGLTRHGITAAPALELPEQWLSMLSYYLRRRPDLAPLSDGCAGVALAFPPVDGVSVSVLGLHNGPDGTMLHTCFVLPGAMPAQPDRNHALPLIWLRDDGGRWHATRRYVSLGHVPGEPLHRLEIVPPLPRTATIEVVVSGATAEVRAKLSVRWSSDASA